MKPSGFLKAERWGAKLYRQINKLLGHSFASFINILMFPRSAISEHAQLDTKSRRLAVLCRCLRPQHILNNTGIELDGLARLQGFSIQRGGDLLIAQICGSQFDHSCQRCIFAG